MKLKVCGMKYQDNIEVVANLQPDYLGFIFHESSSRHFENQIPKLPKSIKKVGVFVNKDLDFVKAKIESHQLDAVQLHGQESPEFCEALRHYDQCPFERSRRLNDLVKTSKEIDHLDNKLEIIKVFSIKDEFDFSVLESYETVCDYFLFDTKGKLPGGNGYTFDWSVLNKYPSTKPFFLSGGIGLDQVKEVLSFIKKPESKYCYAIDVNSKFEVKPGLKDIEALNNFKKEMCHFE